MIGSADDRSGADAGGPRVQPTEDPSQVSFQRSLLPILVADDQRRYVDANPAACLLLRLPRARVIELRIDDLTPVEHRPMMEKMWQDFLDSGTQAGLYELQMPDGQRLRTAYSASAGPAGRHLSILDPQSEGEESIARTTSRGAREVSLTAREREILALVAMGETGQTIARDLGISMATVETHIRRLLAKLGAKNRPHAVLLALKRGDISLL